VYIYTYTPSAHPPAWAGTLIAGIRGISPHRVYLVSLQHNLYILSVALVLSLLAKATRNDGC